MSQSCGDPAGEPAEVELRVPARGEYVFLVRSAAAGLAGRHDFTLDEIDDLRIAVDEACALLLPAAEPGTALRCAFRVSGDTLAVRVAATTRDARPPQPGSFAWTVLQALAGEVAIRAEPAGDFVVELAQHRSAAGPPVTAAGTGPGGDARGAAAPRPAVAGPAVDVAAGAPAASAAAPREPPAGGAVDRRGDS